MSLTMTKMETKKIKRRKNEKMKSKSKNYILIILYVRRLLIIYFFCLKINNKVI